jgi:hypothetical protein
VYAGNGGLCLPRIYSKLVSDISEERLRSADIEAEKSILETQSPHYDPDQTREQRTAANWHYQSEDDEFPTLDVCL